jgi:long-chain acyl-CoA synthetase
MLIQSSSAVKVRSEQSNLNVFVKSIDEDDCYISYLPAAHSFEQCIMAMHFVSGMKCGFFAGNTLKLTDDIAKL